MFKFDSYNYNFYEYKYTTIKIKYCKRNTNIHTIHILIFGYKFQQSTYIHTNIITIFFNS